MEMQNHQQEDLNTRRAFRVSMGWEPPPADYECPYKPKTAKALDWALRMTGVEVRHNLRRHATEYRFNEGEWKGLNGRAIARITSDIEDAFTIRGYRDALMPLKFGREAFTDCLTRYFSTWRLTRSSSTWTIYRSQRVGAYFPAYSSVVSRLRPASLSLRRGRLGPWC